MTSKTDKAIKALDKLDQHSIKEILKSLLLSKDSKVEDEVLSKLSNLQSKPFDIKGFGSSASLAIKYNDDIGLSALIA
jgi:hypothetical protein